MKKNTVNRVLMIIMVALLLSGTDVYAWGPDRPTYPMDTMITYPVFNSFTDNPTIGDERDFVRIGEITKEKTDLVNEVEIVPGHQYLVYIYFHNNASAEYNLEDYDRVGIARAVRLASSFTKIITPGEKGTVTATITADNTDPLAVWDEAYYTTTSSKVYLHYVDGSAKIYDSWQTDGNVLPDSLFSVEGTLLGLSGLNGVVPGGVDYHGIVSYVIQADELKGSIEKCVFKKGEDVKVSNLEADEGDELTFELIIKNEGSVPLTHAVIKDSIPDGLKLIPDSVECWVNDSKLTADPRDDLFKGGVSFEKIETGNIVRLIYRAEVICERSSEKTELKSDATLVYDSNLPSGDTDTSSVFVTIDRSTVDLTGIAFVVFGLLGVVIAVIITWRLVRKRKHG